MTKQKCDVCNQLKDINKLIIIQDAGESIGECRCVNCHPEYTRELSKIWSMDNLKLGKVVIKKVIS